MEDTGFEEAPKEDDTITLGAGRLFVDDAAFAWRDGSPFSDPASLPVCGVLPPPEPPRTFASTLSTIPLRVPFFVISFLRSARAASVTAGPVNSSTIDC